MKQETPKQVFSCEFCKKFCEHLFYRTPPSCMKQKLQMKPIKSYYDRYSQQQTYLIVQQLHWICFQFRLKRTNPLKKKRLSIIKNSYRRWSIKKILLKILQYSQETPVLESLFNKVTELWSCVAGLRLY